MSRTISTTTHVLPGRKIIIDVPEFEEGSNVTVRVVQEETGTHDESGKIGILDVLASLPKRARTPEYWAERERELQEDRDSWDR